MLDSEFRLKRHQAADSMRIVFGLDWAAFLMRNLSPMAIIKEGRIDWILNGHPGARRLFDCG
jgi:hypothetical protein